VALENRLPPLVVQSTAWACVGPRNWRPNDSLALQAGANANEQLVWAHGIVHQASPEHGEFVI